MSNLLNTGKQVLKERAIEFYVMRSEDIDIDKTGFQDHFAQLGEMLYIIEKIETFSEMIMKLEKRVFELIGFFPEDEDMMDFFLELLEDSK